MKSAPDTDEDPFRYGFDPCRSERPALVWDGLVRHIDATAGLEVELLPDGRPFVRLDDPARLAAAARAALALGDAGDVSDSAAIGMLHRSFRHQAIRGHASPVATFCPGEGPTSELGGPPG